MGYYIETGTMHGKAQKIIEELGAIEISQDEAETFIKECSDCAVICVVDNGPFEAAAYCYNLDEFRQFTLPIDDRPKTWLLVEDRERVEILTGKRKAVVQ